MSEQYIVLAGNVVEGITTYGPFNSQQEAIDWGVDEEETASGVISGDPWLVTVLNLP